MVDIEKDLIRLFTSNFGEDEKKVSECRSEVVSTRKVHWSDNLINVQLMYAWPFAYRVSRKGFWEQCARDRERFHMRINRINNILKPILSEEHRCKIWNERYPINEKKK